MGRHNYKIYTPEKYANKISKELIEKYVTPENIMDIKITDISCGTGNLLLAMLENLIQKTKLYFGEYKYSKNWITGYDIDVNALKEFQCRIEELTSRYSFNVSEKTKLHLCDSLIKKINVKYDIVIGNPPYLGEKNHKEIFEKIKNTEFGEKNYSSKMDYFYFFIFKGIDILKENGVLAYLTTNYWFKADSANLLRKKLKNFGYFERIESYDTSVFEDAKGQHNVIFYWRKNKSEDKLKFNVEICDNDEKYTTSNGEIYFLNNDKISLIPDNQKKILDKIYKKSNVNLGDIVNINQGIVSGKDEAFVFKNFDKKFKEYLKPFYKNKDIGKYEVSKNPDFWIMYLNKNSIPNEIVFNYLSKFKDELSKRREVINKRIDWWELQWSRNEELFLKPKIVVRQRCKTNNFAYTDSEFYGSADIYYIVPKNNEIDLFYILGYLNSELFLLLYTYLGKKKGKNLEFYSTPLKEVPIYYPEDENEIKKISKLVQEQVKNFSEVKQSEIDKYFEKILDKN